MVNEGSVRSMNQRAVGAASVDTTTDHVVASAPSAERSDGSITASERADGNRATAPLANWLPAVVLGGLTAVAMVRQGGFWHADAVVVAAGSLAVLLVAIAFGAVRLRWRKPEATVVVSLLLFDCWWLERAHAAGATTRFFPLGASVLGFAAAFACTRTLKSGQREVGACFVAILGASTAVAGLFGLVVRWDPLAIPSQYLWRLSGTVTYANAAGLVLALGLVMALGMQRWPSVARASICLCIGGLIATQSRGPVLAFAAACAFVPLDRYLRSLVPLAAGLALGVAAVATSGSDGPVPLLALVAVAALLVSVMWAPTVARRHPAPRQMIVAAVAVVVVAGCCAGLLQHQIALRALTGDRSGEWSTGVAQFRAAPLVGVGADQPLEFRAVDGSRAFFVHNEYLQITADAGVVGLALVAAIGVALAMVVRRRDVLGSCAVAGLVCWALAAGVDFDWHLPVIGLMGGWLAGLASASGGPQPFTSAASEPPISGTIPTSNKE